MHPDEIETLRQKARVFSDADLDHRLHPYNASGAAFYLQDKIKAGHLYHPTLHMVSASVIDVYQAADGKNRTTQLLAGEFVDVYDHQNGFSWVQNLRDGYVGYVKNSDIVLVPEQSESRDVYIVTAPSTFIYVEADIKSPNLGKHFMGAKIAGEKNSDFLKTAIGYISLKHLTNVDIVVDNKVEQLVDLVQKFLGAPYLWGGKTQHGLDCSALVQICLHQLGLDCPRDADQQEKSIGHLVENPKDMEKGDIVFFKGHVGIMIDNIRMLHANQTMMNVSIDSLEDVIKIAGSVTAIRRVA